MHVATPTPTPAPQTLPDLAPENAVCDACPHLLAAHDLIGERYCRATVRGALSRGCACGAP